jgi:hypothetical protein
LPDLRIAIAVEHCKHHDLPRFDLIEDRVWKAPYDATADIVEYLRLQLGCGADPIEDLLYLRHKLHVESRTSLLVPIKRLVELSPSFWPQDYRQAH